MFFSLKWLQEYIDVKMETQDFCHRLTMAGFPVEQWLDVPESVVFAKVLKAEKHPNADKLQLCLVEDGSNEPLQIVCGAPNAHAGMIAVLARQGTVLPGGFKIKKSKIRGQTSSGMLCSAKELGLAEDHEGILEFEGVEIGTPLRDVVGYPVFDLEIPANRGDCMSHLGLARELGALTGRPVHKPEVRVSETGEDASRTISVSVEKKADCPLYCGRIIRNIKVGPSPDWLKSRLEAVGQRGINNVVDITNYVLLETGQPLHAFDLDTISSGTIRVRRAKEKEQLVTLDGTSRVLSPDVLIITDGAKPIAAAGIMGGADTEVSRTTVNVLLEAAVFHSGLTFKGSRYLRLDTEASMRFRRGVDPRGTVWALDRTAQLLGELAGGEIAPGVVRAGDLNSAGPPKITFRPERVAHILGEALGEDQIASRLEAFNFEIDRRAGEPWRVTPPSYRRDAIEECDLVEEVARHLGYDAIGTRQFNASAVDAPVQPEEVVRRKVSQVARGFGFHEVLTPVLGDSQASLKAGLAETYVSEATVCLADAPSKEEATLRLSGVPRILDVLSHNLRHGHPETRIFELGKTFEKGPGSLPEETEWLFLGAVGGAFEPSRERATRSYSLEDLKGAMEAILHTFQIDGLAWRVYTGYQGFPAGAIELLRGQSSLGFVWEPGATVREAWELKRPVYCGQLLYSVLAEETAPQRYKPAPRFPAAHRDVALVVPQSIHQAQVREWILEELRGQQKNAARVRMELFDYYQGEHIPEGSVGLGFSLVFQSESGTLLDQEVEEAVGRVVRKLKKHNVVLRDS